MTRAPPTRRGEADPTPVVFLAFANAPGGDPDYLDRLAREYAEVRRALEGARAWVRVVDHAAATSDDVFRTFLHPANRHRVAVFHFAGHAGDSTLLFRGLDGHQEVAHAGGFAAFLAQQRGLRLVFLNACSTDDQALELVAAGVPVVVATSSTIRDDVAATFARHFYERMAAGDTIAASFAAAAEMTRVQHGDRLASAATGAGGSRAAWPWAVHEGAPDAAAWRFTDAADPCASLPALPYRSLPESPYRDLQWFGREDAELFFGRCADTRRLYDLLTDPTIGSDPIVLLYGRSGAGKSSLLEAGVAPRLAASGSMDVRTARRDAALGLLGTLEGLLEAPLERGWIAHELANERPLVLALDQVEEVFTHPLAGATDPGAELDALCDALARGFSGPGRWPQGKLVLVFSKEWLAEVSERLAERALPATSLFLEPLKRDGLVEAITGPTRTERMRAKYRLEIPESESDLPGLIADDLLADPGSPLAPTLQVLLATLWREARRRDPEAPRFTKALYRDLERHGVHFGDFLDRRLAAVAEGEPSFVDTGLALDVLVHHTTPLGGAAQHETDGLLRTYRHRPDLPRLLQELRDAALLVEPAEVGGARLAPVADGAFEPSPVQAATRLAHDTLGPLVRQRYERSDAPGQRARRILDARAADWSDGRTGAPLDRHDLGTVEQGADGTRAWTDAEARLVAASRRLDRRRQRAAATAGAALGAGAAVSLMQVAMDVLVGHEGQAPAALTYLVLPEALAAAVWPAFLAAALMGFAYLAEARFVPASDVTAAAAERRTFARGRGWLIATAGGLGFGLANHAVHSGFGALQIAWFTPLGWREGVALWAALPFAIGAALAAALQGSRGPHALATWGRRLGGVVATLVVAQATTNLIASRRANDFAFLLLDPNHFDWGLCDRLRHAWLGDAVLSCHLLPEAALLGVALTAGLTLGARRALVPSPPRRAPRERSAR